MYAGVELLSQAPFFSFFTLLVTFCVYYHLQQHEYLRKQIVQKCEMSIYTIHHVSLVPMVLVFLPHL